LEAGLVIGFGVMFALDAGVGLGFVDVAVAVGLGVADGNSISLLAAVTTGFFSAGSSCSDRLDSVAVDSCFDDADSFFSDSPAERSPAPPNHTMLSEFDEALAATLQRINPAISATCASAIKMTFRQNRAFRGMSVQRNEQLCVAEGMKAASSRRTPKPRKLSGRKDSFCNGREATARLSNLRLTLILPW
jgi:hypothetical protein